MSKAYDNAKELNLINYIAGNNSLNFTATVIGNGAPIADVTAGLYANSAFAQANGAFAAANSVNVYGANTTSNNFFAVPIGTTGQRPASAANGAIRYNTTLNRLESYMPSAGWQNVVSDSYQVSYILVAGGGCGGVWHAGGGGGGGVITGTSPALIPGSDTISFTIGGGGTTTDTTVRGTNGSNTTATISGTSYIAQGGGAGGNYDTSPALSGGSGGGGNGAGGAFAIAGSGVPGQGYPGGNGYAPAGHTGGGGGGAGGAGGTPTDNTTAAAGGPGYTWLNGETYAGGGGGGTWYGGNSYNAGPGGTGGGGRGSYSDNGAVATFGPRPGTVNTGGGGGGSGAQGGGGGNRAAYVTGGSGVVILRYQGSQRGTGGTVTSSGGYTYHTFTGTGTFTA